MATFWGLWIASAAIMLATTAGTAQPGATAIGIRHLTLVDPTRGVAASQGFAGSPTRRIDVTVWYPTAGTGAATIADAPLAGGARPLVIYSHGTYDSADNASYLVRALVARGYVVAAPDYPLNSRAAYTHVTGPNLSDVVNQTRDIGFIVDRLLADPRLAAGIDANRIGTFGHSLGAVTSFFASFGARTRDPRIRATALLGAGDPPQAAKMNDMGLADMPLTDVPTPVLFLSAEHDVFAGLTGRPGAAYARVPAPRYEVTIKGGVHVWFRDGDEPVVGGRNPDCLFFDRAMPGAPIPGCAETPALTTAVHQRAVTAYALLAFFDAYLKGDVAARARLDGIATSQAGVTLRHDG